MNNLYWGILVAIISIISIFAHYYLLDHFDMFYVVGLVEAGIVLFSALISAIFLGEIPSPVQWWGIVLIAFGIYFVNLK